MTAVADKLEQIFQTRIEEASTISQLEAQLGQVDTYGDRVTSLGTLHDTVKTASTKRDAESSKRRSLMNATAITVEGISTNMDKSDVNNGSRSNSSKEHDE